MAERWYPQILRAETLWQEGQKADACAALSSIALNTSAIWWARMASLQVLARLGLKDEAISIARAMLGELSAEDRAAKIRLEIAQLLAECGLAREVSVLLLAWVREPLKIGGALGMLAELGFVEEIVRLTQELKGDLGLRFAAAFVLIRFGRIEEGKAILLEFVNLTAEIKNTFERYEEMRWEAAKTLSQFPEYRRLGEQVWEEIARTEKYMKEYNIKVRRVAIMKLKANKQVRALLDIGSNRATPAELRKDIAAALLDLGYTRDAEAIAQDLAPR